MKKALLIILAIVLVGGGLYGAFYLYNLQKAETQINSAVLSFNEKDYSKAALELKEVISNYDYKVVKAPALYLLGVTYEKSEHFSSAEEAYKLLIADHDLRDINNWYEQSIISLSRLYRKGLGETTLYDKDTLHKFIISISQEIKTKKEAEKESGWVFSNAVKRTFDKLLTINYSLNIEELTDEKILEGLLTELGFLYLETKDYGNAISVFQQLNTPVSRFGLSEAYLEMGEYRKGLDILKELIAYDTTGRIKRLYIVKLFDHAETLYKKGQYKEAIELFTMVYGEDPNTTYAELSLYYLAKHYYNIHSNGKALAYIEKILNNTIDIKDEESLLLKGYIYYDKREFMKALKAFNDFIKKYPTSEKLKTAREWKAMTERSIKYIG
jgi:tetratricopeptide (TPR) repeat protein